jgi:hypothetical protein
MGETVYAFDIPYDDRGWREPPMGSWLISHFGGCDRTDPKARYNLRIIDPPGGRFSEPGRILRIVFRQFGDATWFAMTYGMQPTAMDEDNWKSYFGQ